MALTPSSLQPGATLAETASAIVTASSGTTVLTASTFANPTTATVTLEITLTRNGSAAVVLVPGRSVGAGATVQPAELSGIVLSQGDIISASGAGITSVVSGYVVS